MIELDTRLEEALPERAFGDRTAEPTETAEGEAPAEPDLTQVRSLLTEPRPAGFGEVLVTEAWLPPSAEGTEEATPQQSIDSQRAWDTRQELRELKLLRERPLITYDAQTEHYWDSVHDAQQVAQQAIIDPYTELAVAFSGVDLDRIPDHRAEVREYGRAADALVALGRAYMAIGRVKSARTVFGAAAASEPYDPEPWWYLGVSHLFARANAKAMKALRRAADQSPGWFRAEMALGLAQYHARDYSAAEQTFRRLVGTGRSHASARSMLACTQRMQGRWDEARVELGLLRESTAPGDWRALAAQCLDCVERGEQKWEVSARARRRAKQVWKSLAAAGAGGIWMAYALVQDLFRKDARWAALPLFVLAMLLARALKGISGKELPGEFGNAEQGLPCWQATAWMRAHRSEF